MNPQEYHTWDDWKATSKMTDRELHDELRHVSDMVAKGEIGTTIESRHRIQCLCREAAKRVRYRNHHRDSAA